MNGYYDKLLDMLDHAINERFMGKQHRDIWTVFNDPSKVIEAINWSKPPSNDAPLNLLKSRLALSHLFLCLSNHFLTNNCKRLKFRLSYRNFQSF